MSVQDEVEPTVGTQWLAEQLDSGAPLVVLDASVFLTSEDGVTRFESGIERYEGEHIPTAQFADLFLKLSDAESPYPFTRPSAEQFARSASELGIRNGDHVVVYDDLIGQWAARVWWLFRSFGHERVSVLDGGQRKWREEGRPLTGRRSNRRTTDFAAVDRADLVASRRDVQQVVAAGGGRRLVCSLDPEDYSGRVQVRTRAGHIPTSVNIPPSALLDPTTNALRDDDGLTQVFAEKGIDLSGALIPYCGGGIGSALLYLALYRVGARDLALFDGSLMEWTADGSLPLELGD